MENIIRGCRNILILSDDCITMGPTRPFIKICAAHNSEPQANLWHHIVVLVHTFVSPQTRSSIKKFERLLKRYNWNMLPHGHLLQMCRLNVNEISPLWWAFNILNSMFNLSVAIFVGSFSLHLCLVLFSSAVLLSNHFLWRLNYTSSILIITRALQFHDWRWRGLQRMNANALSHVAAAIK